MARTDYQSVSEYIAAQPPATRPVLRKVRDIIRKAVPKADEVISYQIAAYKIDGVPVVFFAGWKEHYALYPASAALVAALGKALAPYEVSKGTIRFPLTARMPVGLITRIVKLRAREAKVVAQARAAAKTARGAAQRRS